MDDLKKYLAALKKNRFWVLTGLLVIVALVTSSKASSSNKQLYDANAARIKSSFSSVDMVRNQMPPNQTFIEKMKVEQKKIEEQAFAAWQTAADLQAPLLKWPEEAKDIGELKPGRPMPENMRERYMNNVMEKEWTRVMEKIRLRRPKGGEQAQPGIVPNIPGAAAQGAQEFEGIVFWDETQRRELIQRYKTTQVPSETRVRVTQEDLWIFESLVDIVNKLNKDATDSLNAPIKQVLFMDVAKAAIDHAIANPGAEIDFTKSSEEESGGIVAPFGSTRSSDDDDKSEELAMLVDRYLDAENRPVPARAVLENPPFAEFKQVFVAMRFVMDQNKIPELLAACANSPLPIETRQVLMYFQDLDTTKIPAGLRGGVAGQVERGYNDCIVEVRGNVYIYNTPVREKLGTGGAENPAQRSMGTPTRPKEE